MDSHSSKISRKQVNLGSQTTSAPNFASILDRVNDYHHVKNNEKSSFSAICKCLGTTNI
jgi:hypothetical protein